MILRFTIANREESQRQVVITGARIEDVRKAKQMVMDLAGEDRRSPSNTVGLSSAAGTSDFFTFWKRLLIRCVVQLRA